MVYLYLGSFVIFLSFYLFTFLGKWVYAADLLANFPHYFVISGLIMFFIGVGFEKFRWIAALFLLVATINFVKIAPFFIPNSENKEGETVRIAQYNQYFYNKRADEVFEWLKNGADGADIVSLDEAEDETLNRLHLIKDVFPYQTVQVAGIGRRNIAVLSRFPFKEESVFNYKNPEKMWHFYVRLTIETPKGNQFNLYATHLSSPHRPLMWNNRNMQLIKIAEDIKNDPAQNKILVGDLNVSPSSFWFNELTKISGLKNSIKGNGFSGTWPSFAPNFMRVTIDHILYSGNISAQNRKVLPAMGSDHLPVQVELKFF